MSLSDIYGVSQPKPTKRKDTPSKKNTKQTEEEGVDWESFFVKLFIFFIGQLLVSSFIKSKDF